MATGGGRGWHGGVAALALVAALATGCADVVRFEPGDPVDFVRQPQTSLVLDAEGGVIAELHAEQDRRDVDLDEVDDDLVAAVVAIEDRRFFLHAGVDVAAVARALVRNVEAGDVVQGGSTITQQYVKNTITGNAQTLERKLQEAVHAWQLEEHHTKREILERYLNTVYFGRGAYGVHAAARRFFATSPADLDLAQASLLAGLIQSPTHHDPHDRPEAALDRRRVVLDAMVDTGVVTRAEADAAAAEPLALAPLPTDDGIVHPYVVAEVVRLVQHDPEGTFAAALGPDLDDRVAALFTGGLRVHTTLDPTAQVQAEQAVASVLHDPDDPSAALVAIDPATGAVRALVGGRDYDDPDDPHARFNLATQARRQPGSAMKPLVLATALERGVALDRTFPGGSCVEFAALEWTACNYADTDHPELSLREATVRSANTVYARLAVELGGNAIRQQAASLGIDAAGWVPAPALGLGVGEVSPFEMASAYATLAAGGVHRAPHLVTEVRTADGQLLWAHAPTEFRVLEATTAHQVTRTLEEVVRRGTGVRAALDRPLAGKTGTSQGSADAWFVGYTPDLAAAVWVGFPEGRVPMVPPRTRELVEGGRWPAEVFRAFAEQALADVPPHDFVVPDVELVAVEVDAVRNCRPGPATPRRDVTVREYLRGTEPTATCDDADGAPSADVPDLDGLPVDVARRLLADVGLRVVERPVRSPVFPPGYVTAQRPAPGATPLPEDGGAVVLWVSVVSTERAVVTDVVGRDRAAAVALLEADGWVAQVRAGCPGAVAEAQDGPCEVLAPGTVWATAPAPGTRERRHSPVTVHVVPTP